MPNPRVCLDLVLTSVTTAGEVQTCKPLARPKPWTKGLSWYDVKPVKWHMDFPLLMSQAEGVIT